MPATKDSDPTVQRSVLSAQSRVLEAEPPLKTVSPASSVGVPDVKLLLIWMMLSAKLIVSELTVVVVPETVKSPVTVNESLTVTIPEPLAESVKLVSVDLLSIASTSILLAKEIALPPLLVILTPSSICNVLLIATRPEPVASNSISPDPAVCTEIFWLVSAETVIVPELSDNTFCPLTYKDPSDTYKSRHANDELPKSKPVVPLELTDGIMPSPVILKRLVPSTVTTKVLLDPESLIARLVSFCAIVLVFTSPVMVPVVVMLPFDASIVNAPTVKPFLTTKLLFAIVPYLP